MTRPALLLIDLINPFDFASGEALIRRALPAARATGELKARARAIGVKPKHSGFYCTDLDALLQLEVCNLILTGVAADICVLPMPQCGPAL